MKLLKFNPARFLFMLTMTLLLAAAANGQQRAINVLTGAELTRIVPTSFYFEGQSAPTQMRNAAAARLSPKRHVIAGLVDTSGYSSEIRAKYEGFLITDSRIRIGGDDLDPGAYGFGFTDNGKLNIFDVGGNQILSVSTANDKNLRRPRPLMMTNTAGNLRFYAGRDYVVVAAR